MLITSPLLTNKSFSKKFAFGLLTLSLVCSNTGLAQSWQEIRKSETLIHQDVQVNFKGQLISVFDVCQSRDSLKTRMPVKTYQWNGDDFLANNEAEILVTDVTYSKPYTAYDTTIEQVENYPRNYSLLITDKDKGQSFYKDYQIPAC